MTSPGPEADGAQYLILSDGFIYAKDAALGQRVSAMTEANIPLGSVGGFAFLKQNIIDNSVCGRHWFRLTQGLISL